MFRVASFITFLLITTNAFAQVPHCGPDGSLLPSFELGIKLSALHYANRSTPLENIKALAANTDMAYTKPACDSDGRILPWDDLHIVLTPK